jgi:protein-S-isoprenylcysteine O-methyltransferase Ste14
MLMVLRHLVAVALLPFMVAVVIPLWIARGSGIAFEIARSTVALATQLAGLVSLAVGLALFGASLRNFAVRGRGTLAPWDPPKTLVVDGPYRYVRNPMIAGVVFIVFGEALILRSWPHARWAIFFLAVNAVYIPLLEEPLLERRFGNAYREYRRHVRRFLPRTRPWSPLDRVRR